jgi:hypothetical protein
MDYRRTSSASPAKSFNYGFVTRSIRQCSSSRLFETSGPCESAIIIAPSHKSMAIW